MKKADIKLGFLCNSNCRFCVQGDRKKALGNKTTVEIKKIIKMARQDSKIVVFTGGEVTVRKDILELVGYARQLNFQTIQIQTNGREFVCEEFTKNIIRAGANEFALALHGHIPELHNFLIQSQGFKQTVLGIRNLKKLNQRILMNTVITKPNYRNLPDIVKLLISLEVDQIQLAFVHALGTASKNFDNIVPRIKLVMPYVLQSIRIARYFKKNIFTEAIPYCFLRGYEEHISERVMPEMKVFEHNYVVSDFKYWRINEGKSHGPNCPDCGYYQICEGPWKEYPEVFGWNEFIPVKKTN